MPVKQTKRTKRFGFGFILLILVSFFSYGAFWDFNKSKSDEKKTASKSGQQSVGKTDVPREVKISPVLKTQQKSDRMSAKQTSGEKNLISKKGRNQNSVPSSEDIPKIQEDLETIITRTQAIQSGITGDRGEIEKILARSKIQERILRNLAANPPVQVNNVQKTVDVESALKREKLRILAEQVTKTQQTLKAIENSQRTQKTINVQKTILADPVNPPANPEAD